MGMSDTARSVVGYRGSEGGMLYKGVVHRNDFGLDESFTCRDEVNRRWLTSKSLKLRFSRGRGGLEEQEGLIW